MQIPLFPDNKETAMDKRRKVGIIGVGHVGSHAASMLAVRNLCNEIVLLDIDKDKLKGQAIDLADTDAYQNGTCYIHAGEYEDLKDADILVVSAGGKLFEENRLEELTEALGIIDEIAPKIEKSGFYGIVISVTNPCDLVAYHLSRKISSPVIGSGTILDSARFRCRIAAALSVDTNSVQAWCFGEHGDSQVPVWSQVHINGVALEDFLKGRDGFDEKKMKEKINRSTIYAGWEIASAKGSTEFGVGMAVSELIRCIFEDAQAVLPCSVPLNGEYGEKDVYASILCRIGKDGANPMDGVPLLPEEEQAFHESCRLMRGAYPK